MNEKARKDISLSIHESLVAVYHIPQDDYFQVVHATRPADLLYPDSYLGVPHNNNLVYIQIIARAGRTREMKKELYKTIAEKIAARTSVSVNDVIIVLLENTENDWSFGQGIAQMADWKSPGSDEIKIASGNSSGGEVRSFMASGDPISRRHLLTADMSVRNLTSVQAYEIGFAPGQKGGLHTHPCPVTGVILKGAALLQVEGQEPQVLRAGQAFYEPAATRIVHFDNYSDTEELLFSAFYLLNGEQNLIEMIEEGK